MGWPVDEQAAFAVEAGYRPCRRLFKRRMAVVGSQDGGLRAVAPAWAVRPLRWSDGGPTSSLVGPSTAISTSR